MIENIANPVEEIVNVNRAQIEHRATWMGLIYDEMVKAGIDAEPISRAVLARWPALAAQATRAVGG